MASSTVTWRLNGDDKHVELKYEVAVALAIITEGGARSTVLNVTHLEPTPKSTHDPARAPQLKIATP